MVIVLTDNATEEDVELICEKVKSLGYGVNVSKGIEKTIIGVIGAKDEQKLILAQQLESLHSVEKVIPILKPYKLASREWKKERTQINVNGVVIGGNDVVVMAGPCSVENEEMIMLTARAIKAANGKILRGGAFKPRTSPYSFQGLGEEGLKVLSQAGKETGLPVVTEVLDPRDVELVSQYTDILQIGTRNMTNYPLLTEVGRTKLPVLLKRGLSSTVEEFLLAAEYILSRGNHRVILCERGIRTFEQSTRFTLDLTAVPLIQELSHLPIIVDPSHGTGRWQLVPSMAKAAIAAGADGLIIEVHPEPDKALSDGAQSLNIPMFQTLMEELTKVAEAVGRSL
ncbi:MAG TPA: 3-deoxy-7-phosphoheptulonate synthase [bacterium]|nr:3-deoxy-7-phosphoheptulonate synthase [Dictyoglomota bacterium]HHV81055.1 3-deoxy-7-phosphoheptulonate synthase [bacterium]HOK29010.1 3-deoxy-7-phosphoheptulonate synthase [bacterium]HOL54580.1 3-deoxy-7-phosphoheptulonate synthase [bacterium]HON72747.1 3-deoxy-7-phosphoheptulonate synthase [bacterium]